MRKSGELVKFERRALLSWAAASTFAGGWTPLLAHAAFPRESCGDVDAVAHWIVSTPRDRVLSRALRELGAGLSTEALLGGTLLAAAREVRPNIARFNHAALVVSALNEFGHVLPRERQLALLLWGVDNFKAAQEQDESHDWKLEPPQNSKLPSASDARAALIAALESWDAPAADAALIALIRSAPLDSVFEIVWEYGTRCRANLGHKAIYAMVARRGLPLAQASAVEDVLRSCVASFFIDGRTASAESFQRSRELVVRGIPRRPEAAASDEGVAREVLAILRGHKAEDAPGAIAQILAGGASESVLWDAYVMVASEIAVNHPGVGPLHAFTSTSALHYIARNAPYRRIADLALLQAGAWLCEFRDVHEAREAPSELVRIETLQTLETQAFDAGEGSASARIERVLGEPSEGRRDAARRALSAASTAAGARRLIEDAIDVVSAKGDEAHEFKLAAAVLDEMQNCGPAAQRCALAALAVNMPDPRRMDNEDRRRIDDAIAVSR